MKVIYFNQVVTFSNEWYSHPKVDLETVFAFVNSSFNKHSSKHFSVFKKSTDFTANMSGVFQKAIMFFYFLIGAIPALGQLDFSKPVIYSLHESPHRIMLTEIKNKTQPDLLVMYATDVLHWGLLEGKAGGNFLTETLYTKESNYVQFDIGDLNQDGNNDMVISSYWNNGFKVFLSEGSGTFGAGQYYMAGVHGRGVKIADINQDGFNDILAITTGSGQPIVLHVYKGNGSGVFQEKRSYPSVLATNRDIFIADKNGDGLLDVFISTSFNWIAIYYQQPDGSFTCSYVNTDTVAGVLVTEINNDGKPDLILKYSSFDNTSGADSLIVRLGMVDTLFSKNIKTPMTNIRSNYMTSVDYNLDGWNDLVSVQMDELGYHTDTLIFMKGDGSGIFPTLEYLKAPFAIRYFIWGDVNADNKPDLIVTSDTNTLSVYLNEQKVLGTNELEALPLIIAPNPATNTVLISTQGRHMCIEVYRLDGKKVYSGQGADKHLLSVTDWTKGLYFVRLFNSQESMIKKLLVE